MVENGSAKLATISHIAILLFEVDEEDLEKSVVNVCEEVVLTPFESIGSESLT